MEIINFTAPSTSNIFAQLIIWIVGITSSVVAGVILFTLFLKIITLPFDFISRLSMRKNSIKMEEMRPELEKLQKQYANDKALYNQKMMALYKKNGYSMFGACLPTIITLVIFIIAISGFTDYSQYQNKKYFYEMSVAYNNAVYAGLELDGEYIYADESGKIVIKADELALKETFKPDNVNHEIIIVHDQTQVKDEFDQNVSVNVIKIRTTNGYIEYSATLDGSNKIKGSPTWKVIDANFGEKVINGEYNNDLKNSDGKTFAEMKAINPEITPTEFLKTVCSTMSANTFRNNGSKFLWVKNIWVTDSAFKHPIEEKWDTFKSTYNYKDASYNDIGQAGYDNLIADLSYEKTAPNGFFILVALTAASSLLMQLVMSKSQKAQMELQTVDGQGAQTQKIMTWMMPIMMAVFAFIYTAAFSIYIILSSVISLLTTLLINFIADKKYKAKPQEEEVIRGRVYIPPKEEKKEQPKKKKKDEIPENDFLSGLADKKGKKHRK